MLAATTAFAQSPDDDTCTDYSGKAFGICASAINKGCGTEDETNEMACDSMENHFIDETGEFPPWLNTLNTCPCWTKQQLAILRFPKSAADEVYSCRSSLQTDYWQIAALSEVSGWEYVTAPAVGMSGSTIWCALLDYCLTGDCLFGLAWEEKQIVTETQYASCLMDIIKSGQKRCFDCWD